MQCIKRSTPIFDERLQKMEQGFAIEFVKLASALKVASSSAYWSVLNRALLVEIKYFERAQVLQESSNFLSQILLGSKFS